jgi:hypothetical protein
MHASNARFAKLRAAAIAVIGKKGNLFSKLLRPKFTDPVIAPIPVQGTWRTAQILCEIA